MPPLRLIRWQKKKEKKNIYTRRERILVAYRSHRCTWSRLAANERSEKREYIHIYIYKGSYIGEGNITITIGNSVRPYVYTYIPNYIPKTRNGTQVRGTLKKFFRRRALYTQFVCYGSTRGRAFREPPPPRYSSPFPFLPIYTMYIYILVYITMVDCVDHCHCIPEN